MAVKEATLILSLPFFIVRRRSFPPFLDNFPINNFNSTLFPLSLLPIKGENKDNQLYFAVIQLVQVAPALFPCSHSFRQQEKQRERRSKAIAMQKTAAVLQERDRQLMPPAMLCPPPGRRPWPPPPRGCLFVSLPVSWLVPNIFPWESGGGEGISPSDSNKGLTTQGGGSRGSGN